MRSPTPPPRDYPRGNLVNNIFGVPFDTSAPPNLLKPSQAHPVPVPAGIPQGNSKPIPTNAFFGNLLVEPQNLPIWTHPYSVWRCSDPEFNGLAVAQIDDHMKVFGPEPDKDPVQFFFNPGGIVSVCLGCDSWTNGLPSPKFLDWDKTYVTFSMDNVKFTLVQGMGFVTGVYGQGSRPVISSKVGIASFRKVSASGNCTKFVLRLFDNVEWSVYVNSSEDFDLADRNHFVMKSNTHSELIVQVAKGDFDVYDQTAGCYIEKMHLEGNLNGQNIQYSFNYSVQGNSKSGSPLIWTLPHQYASMEPSMQSRWAQGPDLNSTVKGRMKAFVTNRFEMVEKTPPALPLDPWNPPPNINGNSLELIKQTLQAEVAQFSVEGESDTDSMYTSGKILDKGAYILYVAAFIVKDRALATEWLDKMKRAFERFTKNEQKEPLVYDTHWKGVVSSSGLDGNFYKDFGNTFYNDHHFHYGYHIHTAALITLADRVYSTGKWLDGHKQWIETLIRDVANPNSSDPYFSTSRAFDWFHGHSWANGLFASGDGKDEESSSEDYNFAYALHTYGKVAGNSQMETIGALMMSVLKRSVNSYMLFGRDNSVVPAKFKRNKCSGILFENKIDHVTYFGLNKEYIHGIHMIPVTPCSFYVRSAEFVNDEWNEQHFDDLVKNMDSGWRGILMLNLAIADSKKAWNFFAQSGFNPQWLDNGMSRTWSLALIASVGGS
ncbi:unnamed protein product [Kuraishia capsulata CBS 1993]|uniref:glucan endo-1,3-beta-D-glucosidase n=1 Tax=Kuraishia capsulata CBS 1993 TaxID=1382522 RepID=W6MKL7_9ASCO|nr:uncharacterized protein KUCA_T00001244001 [Kuraishia capsulata CBS 1993]CDK25277.1 unnamed protein product [Kuraishia capsulata CBS 1993]